MRQITSAEFKQAIDIDPAWASTITESIEITDYCNMVGSNISHLSPLLTFSEKNDYGDSADFSNCENLKIATGNYKGSVHFSYSGVEKIEHLNCGKNSNGNSANFENCKNLKIATGNYPGLVDFSESGIEKIKNLNCGKDKHGGSAYFYNCKNLKIIEGNFLGSINTDMEWDTLKESPSLPTLKIGNLKTTGITGNPEWNPIFEKISDRWPPEPNRKSLKEWEDLLKPIQAEDDSNSLASLKTLIANEIQLSKNRLKYLELKKSTAVELEF